MSIENLSLHFSKFFWRLSFTLYSNIPRFSSESHFPQRLSGLIKLTNLKISSRNLIKIAKCYLFDEFSWDWRSRIYFCLFVLVLLFVCWDSLYVLGLQYLRVNTNENLQAWRLFEILLLQLISAINRGLKFMEISSQKNIENQIRFWTLKRLSFFSVSFSDQTWNISINQI